jgi:hypothetical protein
MMVFGESGNKKNFGGDAALINC